MRIIDKPITKDELCSMINIRPYQNNPGRDVYDPEIREQIHILVEALIK